MIRLIYKFVQPPLFGTISIIGAEWLDDGVTVEGRGLLIKGALVLSPCGGFKRLWPPEILWPIDWPLDVLNGVKSLMSDAGEI